MRLAALALVVAALGAPLSSQPRRPPTQRRPAAPAPSAMKKEPPELTCPTPLGVGVKTKIAFCEVMAGREPAAGVVIKIPPHKGPATLTFALHNLHLYSDELVRAKRAYARYTATIGAL